MEQCSYYSQTELGSNPVSGTLLAGGLEQVTYLFESCRMVVHLGMVYMILGTRKLLYET